ncbi:HAAS signaling domain-containing protein [Paenibacillus timonensis]|uniref:HAAS signaling domain-containing protein n=1 Tax=Paenibacillus timonensis TaxID=225915 RepID=UPI003F954522
MSPSELIELYIYEVTRRLPEQSRGDIALELRSTIEDMLPEDYGEAEVKEALSQLGDPAALAAQYRDQPAYLIGPRYFDSYVQVMKMVIPIAVVIALLSLIANQIITYSGEVAPVDAAASLLSKAIEAVLGIGIQTVFWITLVFVILERTGTGKELPLNGKFKAWTPDDLKDARYVPKEKVIKKSEVFFSLMWTAIWGCVYFNADRLIGVYENGRFEMTTPVFNQEVLLSYWPFIVLILVLDVALAIYKWVVSQWTIPIAFLNVANHVLSAVVFAVMIRNADLLSPGFISKMEEIFGPQSLGVSGFNSEWVMWLALFAYLLAAALDSYQGFRKANISKP